MAYEFTFLTAPYVLSALFLFGLWLYIVTSADISGPRLTLALSLWALPIFLWAIAATLRLAATSLTHEQLWHSLRFVGPAIGSVGYLLFAGTYTGRHWLFRPRYFAGLFVIPVLTVVLAWTNMLSVHNLVRSSVTATTDGPLVMSFEFGPWFFVHSVYSYAAILLGGYWLFSTFLRRHRQGLYRRQVSVLLLATAIVAGSNGLFIGGFTTLDWTPVAGGVATVLFVVSITQYEFLNVSPIARDTVVENMDNGMLVVDSTGAVVDVDDQAAGLLADGSESLLGEQFDDVFVTPLASLSEEPTTVRIERDGTERSLAVTASPITGASERTVGRVVLVRDVTARVRRQNRLQEQKRTLERQNERLDQFASVVSHDLRNPLGVAQLRLELLDEDSEHTRAIEDALERMETMIHDLLTMARADTMVDDEETERIELRALAAASLETTDARPAEFDLDVPDGAVIEGHWSLLRTAFENLFRNALDHNDDSVTVRLGTTAANGELVEQFYIEDDGDGIPADEREDIFEYGHTTSADGTGFGLAIVREIVQAHGWTITVTEGSDGGARFEIRTTPQTTDDALETDPN